MKALKSSLAKDVLADAKAKGQLRAFLAVKSAQGGDRSGRDSDVIEVLSNGRLVRVKPMVVAKAA